MKINAFETQKVSFNEISRYGWLFLETCILLKPNLVYLDCGIFILAINRTLLSWPLKKKTKNKPPIMFYVTEMNIWPFFCYFSLLCSNY